MNVSNGQDARSLAFCGGRIEIGWEIFVNIGFRMLLLYKRNCVGLSCPVSVYIVATSC